MKIYTRQGDDGSTGLLGPGRIPKSAPRVEAYGSVDELNATLGVVRALDTPLAFKAELDAFQYALFAIGAVLATTAGAGPPPAPGIPEDCGITVLEAWIDRFEAELEPLRNFIIPGGTLLAAQFHVARTVCRRAERRVVSLARQEPVDSLVVRYLNRLADLLFVMARVANHRASVADVEWHPRTPS